jgi:2-methylisocitrate lyase-like PEP mutase family enzyme
MTSTQHDQATLFRSLHTPGQPIVLANAWDVASARIAEAGGVAAVATTSAGVAWSLGAPDGDELDRALALELIARIVAAVDVPVTADIESGYAVDADGVGETVRGVLAAGAVGVNIEDARPAGEPGLREAGEQATRITAARAAADAAQIPLFVNARIDTYLRGGGDGAARFAETVARASRYLDAGADGIFVPGVADRATLGDLTAAIAAPLNVMVGPGASTVAELAAIGVARVSLGASIAAAAYGLVQRAVREALQDGSYSAVEAAIDYGEMNSLLAARGEARTARAEP